MKFDVYADVSKSGSDDEFQLSHSGVTAEFICEWTGRHIDDFHESMTERGFNEFEVGRRTCALVVEHGAAIPADAYMKNRK